MGSIALHPFTRFFGHLKFKSSSVCVQHTRQNCNFTIISHSGEAMAIELSECTCTNNVVGSASFLISIFRFMTGVSSTSVARKRYTTLHQWQCELGVTNYALLSLGYQRSVGSTNNMHVGGTLMKPACHQPTHCVRFPQSVELQHTHWSINKFTIISRKFHSTFNQRTPSDSNLLLKCTRRHKRVVPLR